MARFVVSRGTKSETASKPLSLTRVHDLIEAQGIGIVERMDGGILIDCTAAQAKALGACAAGCWRPRWSTTTRAETLPCRIRRSCSASLSEPAHGGERLGPGQAPDDGVRAAA